MREGRERVRLGPMAGPAHRVVTLRDLDGLSALRLELGSIAVVGLLPALEAKDS